MITVDDVVQEGEGPEDARDGEEFDIENLEDNVRNHQKKARSGEYIFYESFDECMYVYSNIENIDLIIVGDHKYLRWILGKF